MYDFALTDEQQLINQTAQQFGKEQLYPAFRDHEREGVVSNEMVEKFSALGLAGIEIPEKQGGVGLNPLDKVLVLEGLAQGDASAALALDGIGPALYPLLEMGGEQGLDLIAKYSEQGSRGWVIWDTEERFSLIDGRIRGRWPWIPVLEPELLIILKNNQAIVLTDGFKTNGVKPLAMHAAGSAELEVNAAVDVGFESAVGFKRSIARLRCYSSALLVGIAAAALDYGKNYAQERVVFGKPVAHHQGMAFMIAELATRLQGARLNLWLAANSLEREGDPTLLTASAYVMAVDTAIEIGEQGVQLLGGHGYMQDHPAEKWMREAKTVSQCWGGSMLAVDDMATMSTGVKLTGGFELPEWAN